MKIIVFIILSILFFNTKSFSQYLDWANSFSAGNSYALKTDKYGNSYIIGSFNNIIDLDPTLNTYTLSSTTTANDIFVAKYSPNGSLLFAFSLGSTGDDIGKSIDVDNLGNIVVFGEFFNTVDFDTSSGVDTLCAPSSSRDNFIAKYDSLGNFLWANHFTKGITGSISICKKIHIDSNNDIIATGELDGVGMYFSNGNSFTFLPKTSISNDIYFVKYLSDGSFFSAFAIGGTMYDKPGSVDTDSLNNIYVSGRFISDIDLDPSSNTAILSNTTAVNANNIFVSKYTPQGNFIWGKIVVAANVSSAAPIDYEMAIQRNGNVYITGSLNGSCDFDPSMGGVSNLVGNYDCFYAKYDSNGNYLWANKIGGNTYSDYGIDIEVDSIGNLFILGNFTGTVDFNPSSGTTNMTSTDFTDLFFGKYNSNGAIIWVKHIGTANPKSIEIDQYNNVYLYGNHSSTGNVDFDPNSGVFNLNGTSTTLFLAKYESTVATEVEENSFINLEMFLYPNPANKDLYLNLKKFINCKMILITDIFGRKIYSQDVENKLININVEQLKTGVYFVSFIDDKNNSIGHSKFLKE